MLRPERVRIVEGSGAGDQDNVFDGEVASVVYQGDSVLVQAVLFDGTVMRARMPAAGGGRGAPHVGDRVRLGLGTADTVLVADDGG